MENESRAAAGVATVWAGEDQADSRGAEFDWTGAKMNAVKRKAEKMWLRAEEVSQIRYDSAERTDWYWWWDEDGLPLPVYVAYSPTSESYFATQGQLGWNRSQEILDMGGWWMPLPEPSLPESE